jgi:transposase-like protein
MPPRAPELQLSDPLKQELERIVRSRGMPQSVASRARIVLGCARGGGNIGVARELGVDRQRVRRWRNRWLEVLGPELEELELAGADSKTLHQALVEALSDKRPPPRPHKRALSAEQEAQLLALACRSPEDVGLPFSVWSLRSLAAAGMARGIADYISPAAVWRALKRGA